MALCRIEALSRARLVCLAAALAPGLAAADEDAITPYRPSVSSPAQLPVAGQLELELGGIHVRSATRGAPGCRIN